ncbi:hypothetical protein Amet_1925 [Alkaliphilus metalliredigens QYMF]|nr:transcriptional regulator [Alkaliphilus metalliredigens]ABR46615.1 hypothetical protein Amet_0387 [Alkaliphilus metalliredigens QYMF]ABR48089.1 hypothetical protein Amet_1925 [Alkaliphilus metalliredigens QYMF]
MRKNKMTEFGLWIKQSLLELDMTQRELSESIGIDERFLSMILYGLRPGYDYRDKIRSVIEGEQAKKIAVKSKTA